MPLLQLLKVDLAVGGPKLLDGVDFTIDPRERVCIVGRNGMGKTTLMRLLAGEIRADDGEVRVSTACGVAGSTRKCPQDTTGRVRRGRLRRSARSARLLAEYTIAPDLSRTRPACDRHGRGAGAHRGAAAAGSLDRA
jgi:ATP-binding cassette subfamily F protein uup